MIQMPWFLILSLKGISQVMHQCLSSWKQLGGECTFLSCCVPSPSRQGGIDAISCWSFSSVMSRPRCMGEVISFFPTEWILLELINTKRCALLNEELIWRHEKGRKLLRNVAQKPEGCWLQISWEWISFSQREVVSNLLLPTVCCWLKLASGLFWNSVFYLIILLGWQ